MTAPKVLFTIVELFCHNCVNCTSVEHGVNNKCLRHLSEENVATISGELSTGGGAIFKKLCSDALSIDVRIKNLLHSLSVISARRMA